MKQKGHTKPVLLLLAESKNTSVVRIHQIPELFMLKPLDFISAIFKLRMYICNAQFSVSS